MFPLILAIPTFQNITQIVRILPPPTGVDRCQTGDMQNPSILTTRATRKTTRI